MKFAIAAGHEVTAQTACEILKSGGNVFDAAIAASITSWLTEPCMASAGGGGFATIYTEDGQSKVLDFFCQTPSKKRLVAEIDFFPVEIDFGTAKEVFHIGRGAVAVPGSVAGIFELHRQYGYMPLKELVQPTINLAKSGIQINDFQHLDFSLLKSILGVSERGKALFFNGDELKKIGDWERMPFLADFLDFISREGEEAFYKGEIAQKIVADQQANGGYLSREDFENYKVIHRQPLSFSFLDKHILTNPFPSKGGKVLQTFLKEWESNKQPVSWLNQAHLQKLHATFKATKKSDLFTKINQPSDFPKGTEKRGSTTHLGIIDNKGNGISMTVSNGEGCGHFIENTDIQLNNMLGEAALMPNGFHNWKKNIRLSSMMSPTLVLNENRALEIVLGSGGAGRIPYAIGQVLINFLHFKKPLEVAVNDARVHLSEGILNVESGFEDIPSSKFLKKWEEKSLYFGGVHSILKQQGGMEAVGDQRRDGVVRFGEQA